MQKITRIRIRPNAAQKQVIDNAIDVRRQLTEMYILDNIHIRDDPSRKIMFSKEYLDNMYIQKPTNPKLMYIMSPSKSGVQYESIKRTIEIAERYYINTMLNTNAETFDVSWINEAFVFNSDDVRVTDDDMIRLPILGYVAIRKRAKGKLYDRASCNMITITRNNDKYYLNEIFNDVLIGHRIINGYIGIDQLELANVLRVNIVIDSNYMMSMKAHGVEVTIPHYSQDEQYMSANRAITALNYMISTFKVEPEIIAVTKKKITMLESEIDYIKNNFAYLITNIICNEMAISHIVMHEAKSPSTRVYYKKAEYNKRVSEYNNLIKMIAKRIKESESWGYNIKTATITKKPVDEISVYDIADIVKKAPSSDKCHRDRPSTSTVCSTVFDFFRNG